MQHFQRNFLAICIGFIGGIAGNLIAGWIQTSWQNQFTFDRLIFVAVVTIASLVFGAIFNASGKGPKWLRAFSNYPVLIQGIVVVVFLGVLIWTFARLGSDEPVNVSITPSPSAPSVNVENSNNSIIVGGDVNNSNINIQIQADQAPTHTSTPTPTNTPSPTPTKTPTATPTPPIINLNTVKNAVDITGRLCGYGKQHSIVRVSETHLTGFVKLGASPASVLETISTDNGLTWSEPSFVSGFDVQSENIPDLVCSAVTDGLDRTHLIWNLSGGGFGTDTAYIRQDLGGWGEPVIQGHGIEEVGTFAPNIASGTNGDVAIIWSSQRIWIKNYDGFGWTGERDVTSAGWHPDLFIDSQGNQHVVYNDAVPFPSPSVDVYYTFSPDGENWREPIQVNPLNRVWTGAASMVIDQVGRVHVTYIQDSDVEGDLYYTRSDDQESWTIPLKVNHLPGVQTGETGQESASMLIDEWGNIFVVWKGLGEDGTYRIFLKWLDSYRNIWSEPIELGTLCDSVGCHASLPYRAPKWENGIFILDVVWSDADKSVYVQVVFEQ